MMSTNQVYQFLSEGKEKRLLWDQWIDVNVGWFVCVHVAADTNPVVVDDCWLAEPDADAEEDDAPDWLAVDEVDGIGAVAEAGPFGRIIIVAFFNV